MAASPPPRDRIDEWIIGLAPGRSFVDIGGIGVGAGNERTSTASLAGASRVAQADIRPIDYFEWEGFRQVMRSRGVDGEPFNEPVALALDGLGNIYVVEQYGPRLQKFRLLPPFAQ